MNQQILDLTNNLSSAEVSAILGQPLIEKFEGEVKLWVYTSKSAAKADVLYFVNDQLKVKSLSIASEDKQDLEANLPAPNSIYLMQADDRGSANNQWLLFWEAEGVALVSDSKLKGGEIDRAIYFEPMSYDQFAQIWGGSKFVKASEQVVQTLSTVEPSPVAKQPKSGQFGVEPIFFGLLVFVVILFTIVMLWLRRRSGPKSVSVVPPATPSVPSVSEPPLTPPLKT